MTVTVSYLVMYAPEQLRAKYPDDPRLQIQPVYPPRWQFNQSMYRRIGADWYWQEKRDWDESKWRAYVGAPGLHTFAASYAGEPAGYFELRHDPHGGIEIVYFGLLAAFIGGRWPRLLAALGAVACSFANYEARGMRIYRTAIETLTGND